MKKTTLICAAAALLIALPNAESAEHSAPFVPDYPNLDIRGMWKLEDSSEPPGQPKTFEITGRVDSNWYFAEFTNNQNTCPIKGESRGIYITSLKLGGPKAYYTVGGKKISGKLMVRAKITRCSSKRYMELCGGEETEFVKFTGVIEIDPETGKAVRIRGGYIGKYYDVKGKKPNTTCTRNKKKDFERFATWTRIE